MPWDHLTPAHSQACDPAPEGDRRGATPHALIVDGDPAAAASLAAYLAGNGLAVEIARDGEEMELALAAATFDVAVLNVRLSAEDGLSLCRRLWRDTVSIVLLTEECDAVDRIVGLELGADACLPRGCNPREVLAYIRAITRTRRRPATASRRAGVRYRFGDFVLDSVQDLLLQPSGEAVVLTQGERKLLVALLDRPNQVLPRKALADREGDVSDLAAARSVDVRISRLRRKLGEEGRDGVIRTVRGVGYRLVAPVSRA